MYKVYGADIRPTRGRQNPCGPHVGPVNFALWVPMSSSITDLLKIQQCIKLLFSMYVSYILCGISKGTHIYVYKIYMTHTLKDVYIVYVRMLDGLTHFPRTKWTPFSRQYFQMHFLLMIVFIPPPNEVGGGVYWIHLVRPSVRLSVCPSVCL